MTIHWLSKGKDLSKNNSAFCGAAVPAARAGETPAPQVVPGQVLNPCTICGFSFSWRWRVPLGRSCDFRQGTGQEVRPRRHGPFLGRNRSRAEAYLFRKLDAARQQDRYDSVVLEIDSAAGGLESLIAQRLQNLDRVHTVAYIPHQATGGVALVALGSTKFSWLRRAELATQVTRIRGNRCSAWPRPSQPGRSQASSAGVGRGHGGAGSQGLSRAQSEDARGNLYSEREFDAAHRANGRTSERLPNRPAIHSWH